MSFLHSFDTSKKSTGTLSVSASDGYGDQASQVIYDEVQNYNVFYPDYYDIDAWKARIKSIKDSNPKQ